MIYFKATDVPTIRFFGIINLMGESLINSFGRDGQNARRLLNLNLPFNNSDKSFNFLDTIFHRSAHDNEQQEGGS